jgi:hypothetical protein
MQKAAAVDVVERHVPRLQGRAGAKRRIHRRERVVFEVLVQWLCRTLFILSMSGTVAQLENPDAALVQARLDVAPNLCGFSRS